MSNRMLVCTLAALVVALPMAAAAHAQSAGNSPPPPPGMDDPGVQPAPAATAALPSRPVHDALPGGPAASDTPPEVNTRRQGDDIVQEYSHNGRIYMIKVTPRQGVTQTYMDSNGDGRLDKVEPKKSAVEPVYYTLYEWGKPKPKPDQNP